MNRMAKIRQYISNIPEVKEQLKKISLPLEFILSDSEKIIEVEKFVNSHLSTLDTLKLTKRHRPYYDRLKKVLDKLKIEMKIEKHEL